MPKVDVVSAVTGDLFEKDWSKVRGSMQGLSGERRRVQMSRAARGHRAAVFKAIRSGGCHTRTELVRQFDYLTTKSSHIVDSRGVLDGNETLTGKQIEKLADRYTNRWSDGFHPKLGHTTHMLMSFPIGTKGEDVRDIASQVCERFFRDEENGRHFDWLVAVHEDRDHPHAHVVLNRKSQEGEFFYLGRDHYFNYDNFRIAMVEEAEKVGVQLEATRRVHRGVIDYPPRTREVYAAREEGRLPLGRERLGRDLEGAMVQVLKFGREYGQLAKEAAKASFGEALFQAGEILARGGQLEARGEVYAPQADTAEALQSKLDAQIARVTSQIEAAPLSRRPSLQKEVFNALKPVAHTRPLGEHSEALTEPPSDDGAYSTHNIDPERVSAVRNMVTRAQIETALSESGISSELVLARIEAGADNAALENAWLQEDAICIARHDELALEDPDDMARVQDRLERVHQRLAAVLSDTRMLRVAVEAEVPLQRVPDVAEDGLEAQKRSYTAIDHVVAYEKLDAADLFNAVEPDRIAFREEVEEALSPDQLLRVLRGDADAFSDILPDRIDQLQATKVYLLSHPDLVPDLEAVRDTVLTEIVDINLDAQKLATGVVERRGLTHG